VTTLISPSYFWVEEIGWRGFLPPKALRVDARAPRRRAHRCLRRDISCAAADTHHGLPVRGKPLDRRADGDGYPPKKSSMPQPVEQHWMLRDRGSTKER